MKFINKQLIAAIIQHPLFYEHHDTDLRTSSKSNKFKTQFHLLEEKNSNVVLSN